MGLHLYRLDDGCEHVMAASSAAVAIRQGREVYSIGECLGEGEAVACEQIPDDELFTLGFPDGFDRGVPGVAILDVNAKKATAPAHAWAEAAGDGVYVGGEEC